MRPEPRRQRRPRGRAAIHALEPLEYRFCMSSGVMPPPALLSSNRGDGSSSARFAPVYAQLGNGQTVRLGYIQYHNSLDLESAATAAAAANARGGDATLWKPSFTADGLILLTPVARGPASTTGRGDSAAGAGFEALPNSRDAASTSSRADLATKRSAALNALVDAGPTDHGDDATAAGAVGHVGHVETTHPKDLARLATAGIDALTRMVAHEVMTIAIASDGRNPAGGAAAGGDWAANLLAAAHVPAFASLATRAVGGAGRMIASAKATPAAFAAPQEQAAAATTPYFGFSHLDLPYTLAVDSVAAFAEESAHLSAAVGSRARSALGSVDRSAAWGFTLAVLAADLALVAYIHRGTSVRDRDANVLPDGISR
jgi:hypothetical protein